MENDGDRERDTDVAALSDVAGAVRVRVCVFSRLSASVDVEDVDVDALRPRGRLSDDVFVLSEAISPFSVKFGEICRIVSSNGADNTSGSTI